MSDYLKKLVARYKESEKQCYYFINRFHDTNSAFFYLKIIFLSRKLDKYLYFIEKFHRDYQFEYLYSMREFEIIKQKDKNDTNFHG